MKKIISAIIASTALLGAQAASAQTWTPATSPWTWSDDGTLSGLVTVQKGSGPILECKLTLVMVNPGTGSSTTATGNLDVPNHPACPFIILVNGPYAVTYTGGGTETFTFHDVYAQTPLTPGDCEGNITAVFNDSTDDSLTINAMLPEVTPGTGNCTIVGNIPIISPNPVDIS